MFLKQSRRFKDGKEHHYWSLVENRRVAGGRKVGQRHVLYLGEINSSQQAAWRKTIDVFETGSAKARTVALFPEDRSPAVDEDNIVRIRLDQLELRRPRQWGACWLASLLYEKLGAARKQWPTAWRLVALRMPQKDEPINEQTFTWRLRKKKLRQMRRREGRCLLRTNLTEEDPAKLWEYYTQLTQVEEAFKNLKGDLALRPIHHQREDRIEAHIFVAFLAYCLHVTLRRWLRDLAPGLTPRSVLEKFAAVQMIDVHLPTTDGRHVILPRYTQPEKELQVLLDQMKLTLPEQPPPRISTAGRLVE